MLGFPTGKGNEVKLHSAHAYIARDMAKEMILWDPHVEERGMLRAGEGSPRLNINLTELLRCRFDLLLCYLKSRFLALKDSFQSLRRKFSRVYYGNPYDKLISTLLNAGFTTDIVKYIGEDLLIRLETPKGRTATFDFLIVNVMEEKLELFSVILPDDEWSFSL